MLFEMFIEKAFIEIEEVKGKKEICQNTRMDLNVNGYHGCLLFCLSFPVFLQRVRHGGELHRLIHRRIR